MELFGEPSLSTNYNQCPPHTICLGVGEDINHWFWGRGSGDWCFTLGEIFLVVPWLDARVEALYYWYINNFQSLLPILPPPPTPTPTKRKTLWSVMNHDGYISSIITIIISGYIIRDQSPENVFKLLRYLFIIFNCFTACSFLYTSKQ